MTVTEWSTKNELTITLKFKYIQENLCKKEGDFHQGVLVQGISSSATPLEFSTMS